MNLNGCGMVHAQARKNIAPPRQKVSLSGPISLVEPTPPSGTCNAEDKPRDRVLTPSEIRAIWQSLPAVTNLEATLSSKLVILTERAPTSRRRTSIRRRRSQKAASANIGMDAKAKEET
jgi:hypothetical protein